MVLDLSRTGIVMRDMTHVVYPPQGWGQLSYRFADSKEGWVEILVHSVCGTVKIGTHPLDKGVLGPLNG